MSDGREHEWTATHDRTPADNLRALMRRLGPETPTAEIIRQAFRCVPTVGPGDEPIVERIREECEHEHALARAQRWYRAYDDPPAIAISHKLTVGRDEGTTVARADVLTAIEHVLGERPVCLDPDPDAVIDCTGPHPVGYRYPTCVQQGLREMAIRDALLDA